MTDIIWRDPPEPAPRSEQAHKTAVFLGTLRANPGRWAVYSENATRAMKGRLRKLAPPCVELRSVRIRESNPPRYELYVRYNEEVPHGGGEEA